MTQSQYSWFLVQYKPNSAQIACRNLRRQGIEIFHPTHHVTKRDASRFKSKQQPLFPGYLFAHVSNSKPNFGSLNSTYGVSRLVSFGDKPQIVPDDIVEGLIQRCDDDGVLNASTNLKVGDQVKVETGALVDFVGTIEKVSEDQRIWLLMEFMGRSTRMVFDTKDVTKRDVS